jgi:hypothetical protein
MLDLGDYMQADERDWDNEDDERIFDEQPELVDVNDPERIIMYYERHAALVEDSPLAEDWATSAQTAWDEAYYDGDY